MDFMGNDGHLPATRSDLESLRVAVKADFEIVWTDVNADLDDLRAGFKTDFGGLRSEVKADLDDLRTDVKADLGRLDAKLDSSVRRLAKEIIDGRTEFREFRAAAVTKDDFKRLFDAVEGFAGKTQSYDAAKILHGQALTDMQVQMKDHEKRIKGLEDRPH